DIEKTNKEKNKLKKMYVLSTVIFSILFGYILYNIKGQIINSINGTGEDVTIKATSSLMFYVKIVITVILIIIFIVRIKERKSKNGGRKWMN
ncbi:MAG: hypothetical protein LBH32_01590, partial [Dysgonamonadaceae bacterium]|nr:hypothetical protein [Dysgonamonadaceae bacterium]